MSALKILIVEDELLIAKDVKDVLEAEGYEVFINVNHYDQAVENIQLLQPDLVLIDIHIRGEKDGVDLAHYLMEFHRIPYIFLSSNVSSLILERVKETRPFGFIIKPFRVIDLKTTVVLALNNYVHKRVDPLRYMELPIKDDVPFRIKNTITYIEEHLNNKIKIADLARVANWHNYHFIRMFTKTMGMTPYQYILNRRIEKAKALLVETEYSILSIAYDLGFQSQASFSTTFKKWVNTTPEVYRREMKARKKMSLVHDEFIEIHRATPISRLIG
ncbi:helix-turn-helix domain-containing protein [Flavobacterium sp.]|jgi:AraC-like DNA-binding protein|uniref:helix-turn-helix domain-containing protein n=1 Tax=Flavobacterium sp. TaxID=239 RepID=UPI00391A8433